MNSFRQKMWNFAALAISVHENSSPRDRLNVTFSADYDGKNARGNDLASLITLALYHDMGKIPQPYLLPTGWEIDDFTFYVDAMGAGTVYMYVEDTLHMSMITFVLVSVGAVFRPNLVELIKERRAQKVEESK